MTKEDLNRFKEMLLQEQQDLLESIVGETEGEENPFQVDGDLADKAEALSSVAISEGLSSNQKATLEKIRIALSAIREGKYGDCEVCGNEIELDRLEAVPWATTCKEHMGKKKTYN